ncbi:unnamed protein product [Symbiodinium natans]|uniref:Uncharacterized protein n=1 Tax=Symbiodinium natans TaxID=878477 RepID=A0A812UUM3_9DINO|nr:unnamed protein product [Symbiodinium natans]
MAAQAPRSVKFQEDQAEEISVVNTFVHVPDKEARMAWRQKTTRSAPGSMLNIEDDDSTEVYPAERDDREIPNEEEEDEDDDTFPIAMTHVKTYDSFDACFDLEEDVDEESGLDRAPSVQKVSTFDPFEVDKVSTNDPFEADRAGSLSSGRLVANSALPGQTGPMPCRGQENPMPANTMMCVQAIPVQLVPAVIPAPAAMGQGLISVPAPATAPTPSSPSTSPRQPILLGRTGQTALPQGQVEVKMDAAASPLQCVTLPNGKELVRWSVDARKLESQEKQILSPEFELNLGQHGLHTTDGAKKPEN